MPFSSTSRFAFVFAALASITSAALAAPAVACSEAARFGVVQPSPSTTSIGGDLKITYTDICGDHFGIRPKYLDFYMTVPQQNNGHEPNILLKRVKYDGQSPLVFNTTTPDYFYSSNAGHSVQVDVTYPTKGPEGGRRSTRRRWYGDGYQNHPAYVEQLSVAVQGR